MTDNTKIDNVAEGPSFDALTAAHVDITGAQIVEVNVRDDKTVVWVNVDGVCVLRVCRAKKVRVNM